MADPHLLTVLIVSTERALLRNLGDLLRTFGYRVVSCADLRLAPRYGKLVDPAVYILDGGNWEAARQAIGEIHSRLDGSPPIIFLLWDDAATIDPLEVLQSGVSEFLAKPIRNAEVLSRMRVAARLRELDRRITSLALNDRITALLTEHGLVVQMRRLGEQSSWSIRFAVLVVEVDLFDEQVGFLGDESARQMVRLAVERIRGDALTSSTLSARLGPGRFASILVGVGRDEARQRAEALRDAVTHDLGPPVTCSVGVATLQPGDRDLTGLIRRGLRALQLAQDNGRDCVAADDDYQEELRQWQNCVQRGNPFAGNTARDVMTPFTLWLNPEDSIQEACDQFDSSQVTVLPVVDDQGQLVGLVLRDQCRPNDPNASSNAQGMVRGITSRSFVRLDVDASYERVMQHFVKDRREPIVLYKDDRAQGVVTFPSFLAMVSKVKSDSFTVPLDVGGCQRFLVPDVQHTGDGPISAT